jgi:ATP-binding cassette subfamily F protein 3
LSYGERVRLIFARLASSGNQLLILDEPTNHLDIPSREIIEKSLEDYQGAMILVSHDRYFVEKLKIDREFRVDEGRVREVLQ